MDFSQKKAFFWTKNVSQNSRMYLLLRIWKKFFKNVIFQHFLKCFDTFWTWWKMNFLKNFFHILINICILEFWETFVVQKNAFFLWKIHFFNFCLHRFLCRLFRNVCRVHKFLWSLHRFLNCSYCYTLITNC